MTIGTEVFPIAAVRRVIEVIAVLVVDCQDLPLGRGKLSAASGTNQSMKGQRSLPIILLGGEAGPDFFDNLSDTFISGLSWFDLFTRTPVGSKRHTAHTFTFLLDDLEF